MKLRVDRLWTVVAHLCLAAGLTVSFFMWGLAVSLSAALALSTLSWMVLLVLWDRTRRPWRLGHVVTALACGCCVLALIGGLVAVPPLGVAVAVLLALSAPGFRERLRTASADIHACWSRASDVEERNRTSATTPTLTPTGRRAPGAQTREPGRFDPAPLSDDLLCDAWRTSFAELRAARSVSERVRLVERRHSVLSELTRRHEEGVTRWLASGPRAESNPRRFLDRASARRRRRH